ncbi:putative tRNA-splicing endonuclease subunit tsp-2 [Golovinomyces cichoracearum]|uniref:tRNA-intron lyase n=1 Tax=Golovinomyces cichoracearum TaxID=62708 RepID=A0A420ITN5_9PEZI|nr:putative tRNA-splicing endonuclease subunit tsp-2 [Golovinomyces cichoracearum]
MSVIVNHLLAFLVPNKSDNDVSSKTKPKSLTHSQRLNQIYQHPVPLRIFPLPVFVPNNPISLLHILYTWLSQICHPVSSHITPIYQGWLSLETRSIHVTDTRGVRGLWEQGFYGKGNLSRSEPNWLSGERARRENKEGQTSEEFTRKRRVERQKLKWERARKERCAIEQQLLEEAEAILNTSVKEDTKSTYLNPQEINQKISQHEIKPPIGPLELLLLPNSQKDIDNASSNKKEEVSSFNKMSSNQNRSQLKKKTSCSSVESSSSHLPSNQDNFQDHGIIKNMNNLSNLETLPGRDEHYVRTESVLERENCTNITSNNYGHVIPDPKISLPEGNISKNNTRNESGNSVNFYTNIDQKSGNMLYRPDLKNGNVNEAKKDDLIAIKDEEHLQLTLEEAFFLSYALECLSVLDPVTGSPISNRKLFSLCRQLSSFPPSAEQLSSSDDRFMINYVVYHHYRSLGWVVRSGIKFSVDYMLYNRGPVFSHAEFSVLILPSYSDPYWSSTDALVEYARLKQHRSWAWMSCINRVISQVKKTLVLCYVDIPRPLTSDEEESMDPKTKLARYQIREFIISRFLTNRMRAR